MKKLLLILGILVLAIMPMVFAIQPTQQYNKIFLTPFYRESMSQNTIYNYTIAVNPPDGISSVKSAILTFDMWVSPTVTLNVTVNGVACNNPLYVISTTYASAGRGVATFDCSNVITTTGTYNIAFKPTQQNTGSSTAWLDLTYMNNPPGQVLLHGTEYMPGDVGKLFLQFLDSQNQPVTTSECFLSLWYPNDTMLYNNTLMSKLENAADGIYYKNFNVPAVTGVYPASAKCYIPLVFNTTILPSYAYDGFESGNWTGGTGGWALCPPGAVNCQNGWDVEETQPLSTIVTNATAGTGACYRGNYCAKQTGSYGFWERGIDLPSGGATTSMNITFAFKYKGLQNTEHFDFFIFDGNWHRLDQYGPNYGGYTNEVWYVKNYTLTSSSFELEGAPMIGWYAYAPSTGDEFFIDAINISIVASNISLSSNTSYQILRGSGEVHVSALFGQLNSSVSVGSNSSAIAAAVWSSTNRTLTSTAVDYGQIATGVWNASSRNLTYYPPQEDMTNYSRIETSVNTSRLNITGKLDTMDSKLDSIVNSLANMVYNIWNYVGRYIHGELI